MPNNIERGYLASILLRKTAGVAANPTVGTEWLLPSASVSPINNPNLAFPLLVNAAGNISNAVIGKKIPSCVISFVVKPNVWYTAGVNLLKALLTNTDANRNCDEFALRITEDSGATRIFTHMRCVGVSMSCAAMGMGIQVDVAFIAVYGDSEDGSPPTFSTAAAPNAGYLTSVTDVTVSGASDVEGFSLSMVRATAPECYLDGTIYAVGTNSGILTGSFSLVQNSRAVTVPGNTGSVTLNIGATGAGVAITLSLVKMAYGKAVTPGFLKQGNSYSLVDLASGSVPVSFATF